MGIAYAAFYMARYNVAAGNVASVRDELQFSSSFMGWCVRALLSCHGRVRRSCSLAISI